MSFQQSVNRNFTAGFQGEFAFDGPTRCMAVRITTSSLPNNARNKGNVISRAFGFNGEVGPTGQTMAALVPTVEVGGPSYAGVLVHPKHYALQGTLSGGTLAPSMAVPDGTEAEVCSMGQPFVEIFNSTGAALAVKAGWPIAYVPTTQTAGNDALGLPFGAIVAYDPAGVMPAGLVAMKGKVLNDVSMAASVAGALVSTITIVSLTE